MEALLIVTLAFSITFIIVLANSLIRKSKKEAIMAGELDLLASQVSDNVDAEQSAIQLLNNLHQLLSDALATQDIAKVEAITAQLKTSASNLAAAVVANTVPSAPPAPSPEPSPTPAE